MSNEFRNLEVQIVQFVDDHQPGTVKCEFADAHGQVHNIIEEAPVVSLEMLDANSTYPRLGSVRCQVLERWNDPAEQELVRISTDEPDHIQSTDGLFEFIVRPVQIRTRFSLKELLAESDYSKPDAPEDREWIDAPRAGNELI